MCVAGQEMELKRGTTVKLITTGGIGVIVHTWFDNEMGATDCHVAFYGKTFPSDKPSEPPYVLRCFSSSLEIIKE